MGASQIGYWTAVSGLALHPEVIIFGWKNWAGEDILIGYDSEPNDMLWYQPVIHKVAILL